jgi:hypothetical protein
MSSYVSMPAFQEYRFLFSIGQSGHEADDVHSSGVEAENAWSFTSISTIRFQGIVLSRK